jgi:hypothetical protein
MSRLRWRFQALTAALAFLLVGSAAVASDAAMRLHELAARGDIKSLQRLPGKSIEIDAPDKEGSTALL